MVVVPATFKLLLILTLIKLDAPDRLKDDNNVVANKLLKSVLLFKFVICVVWVLIDNNVDVENVVNVVVST